MHYDLLDLDRRLFAFANGLIDYQLPTKLLLVEFIIRLAPNQRLSNIFTIVSRRLALAEARKLLERSRIEL